MANLKDVRAGDLVMLDNTEIVQVTSPHHGHIMNVKRNDGSTTAVSSKRLRAATSEERATWRGSRY